MATLRLILIALIPLLLLVYGFAASWRWAGLGALAWIVALLLKVPWTGVAYWYLSSTPNKLNAAVSGIISSICELGVAAVVFHLNRPQGSVLANVLLFGVAAASAEIVFIVGAMCFEKPPNDSVEGWIKGAKSSFCVRHVQVIERVVALAGHVGARGLVSLSLERGTYELATVALLSFALTDGVAAYGSLKAWDWFDPTTCRKFYSFCAGISTAEVLLFALSARGSV